MTQTSRTDRLTEVAKALQTAQRQHGVIDMSMAQGLSLTQAEALSLQTKALTAPIAGWKVAAAAQSPSTAPMPKDLMLADGSQRGAGFDTMKIEVELAIEVTRDLPPQSTPFTPEQVNSALGAGYVAFELVASRLPAQLQQDPLWALADRLSNGGFAIGTSGADWRKMNCANLAVTLHADGQIVARSDSGPTAADIVRAVVWLAEAASAQGGLKAGQYIITGARIGPVAVDPAAALMAEITGVGRVSLA